MCLDIWEGTFKIALQDLNSLSHVDIEETALWPDRRRTLHIGTVCIARCSLHIAHCKGATGRPNMQFSHCIAHHTVHIADCTLRIAYSTLRIAYSTSQRGSEDAIYTLEISASNIAHHIVQSAEVPNQWSNSKSRTCFLNCVWFSFRQKSLVLGPWWQELDYKVQCQWTFMFSQEPLEHLSSGVRTLVLQPFLWFVFFFTNLFVKRTWLQSAMTWDFHVYKNYESESWSQRQWSSVVPDLWACVFELDQWQQSAVIRSGAEFMNWRTPSPLVMDILSSH